MMRLRCGGRFEMAMIKLSNYYSPRMPIQKLETSTAGHYYPWPKRTNKWQFLAACVGLRKAESSILTQIRTGRIGLAAFLNRARVPDFPSPMCQCGQAEETASHIIAYCPPVHGSKAKSDRPVWPHGRQNSGTH